MGFTPRIDECIKVSLLTVRQSLQAVHAFVRN
nr:MAG TPA: hypothetical protein [Caudoviricetes sp.]